MPSMAWDSAIGKWIRECSKCRTLYIADGDWEEAFTSMKSHFYAWTSTSGPVDGLRSSCKTCVGNHTNGREGNGKTREEMLIAQEGKCSLCGKVISFDQKNANVDHDKRTGKIREILCVGCNVGIGHFDNRLEWLRKALAYLEKHANENN